MYVSSSSVELYVSSDLIRHVCMTYRLTAAFNIFLFTQRRVQLLAAITFTLKSYLQLLSLTKMIFVGLVIKNILSCLAYGVMKVPDIRYIEVFKQFILFNLLIKTFCCLIFEAFSYICNKEIDPNPYMSIFGVPLTEHCITQSNTVAFEFIIIRKMNPAARSSSFCTADQRVHEN